MIYFCNEETIDTTSKEMYQLQGLDGRKTKDGTCYQKESEVFKIYYSNLNILLDESSCYKLTKMKLKHIFLPTGIIYDENNTYSGYKTDYITPLKENEKKITEKSVDCFLNDIYEVKNDIEDLSINRVLVDDFGLHNMIDNGHINIFDVVGYKVIDESDDDYPCFYINNKNTKNLDILIREILISEMKDSVGSNLVSIIKYLDKKASTAGYIKMLEKNTKGYNSIQEYACDVSTKVKKKR